jgi:hypothetical protein
MPAIEAVDYDPSILPSTLNKEAKELVGQALGLGWKLHLDSNGVGCTIVSPVNESQRIHLGKRRSVPVKQMRSKVFRWGDPVLIDHIVTHGDSLEDFEAFKDLFTKRAEALAAAGKEPNYVKHENGEPVVHTVKSEPETTPRYVVSERPMNVRAREGRAYVSETTNVRVWSDGTQDYTCRAAGCTFSSGNRKAPSGHYANVHSEGVAERPPVFEANVTDHVRYAPRQWRIEALAAIIEAALADGGDPKDLAKHALTWVHEQSSQGTNLAAEREPLTAEETLIRIRTLLDDGSKGEDLARIENLERQVLDMTTERDKALAAAEHERERVETLRDLLNEEAETHAG